VLPYLTIFKVMNQPPHEFLLREKILPRMENLSARKMPGGQTEAVLGTLQFNS
jgi:hypothetical protein